MNVWQTCMVSYFSKISKIYETENIALATQKRFCILMYIKYILQNAYVYT